MYDKSYGINWKDVIIKIVLIVLFILLLLWIIPHHNLNPFYDSVFNNNIQTMKDAAKAYYTVDRLPENIGDSTSMTLSEMLEEKMILPFLDKNDEYCDEENSFIKVTKKEDQKYIMRVLLKCKTQEDYIDETIGCYDVCVGDDCKCVTEYEYKQTVTSPVTSYVCPNGYTKDGTKCYQTVGGSSIGATKTTLKGETKEVVALQKANTYKDVAALKTSSGYWKCTDSRYTPNGSTCYRYYQEAYQALVINLTRYVCPSGFGYYGTSQCKSNNGWTTTPVEEYSESCKTITKTVLVSNIKNATYSLTYQYKNSADGKYYYYTECTKTLKSVKNTCLVGTLIDGKCYSILDATPVNDGSLSSCTNGGTPIGNTCYVDKTATMAATWVPTTGYYCSDGSNVQSGNTCKVTVPGDYYCNEGKLSGKKCIITSQDSIDYSCPKEYTPSSDKKKCIKNGEKKYIDATKKTIDKDKISYKWSSEKDLNGWIKTGKERSSCTAK